MPPGDLMCLGLRSASGHVRVGGRLFAPRSVYVGALPELLGGSLVVLSPEIYLV